MKLRHKICHSKYIKYIPKRVKKCFVKNIYSLNASENEEVEMVVKLNL